MVDRCRGRDPGQGYPAGANSVWAALHPWDLDRARQRSHPKDALDVADNLGVLCRTRMIVDREVRNVWERNPGADRVEGDIDQFPVSLYVGSARL